MDRRSPPKRPERRQARVDSAGDPRMDFPRASAWMAGALLAVCGVNFPRSAAAQSFPPSTTRPSAAANSPAPSPARTPVVDEVLRDDANLHDVYFLGSRDGWCVGDRGTVWRTEDGGQTWKLLPVPTDCVLRSVCFLTDRIGWVAGGSTTPFTRVGVGAILATRDGGKTWTSLARSGRPLPQLH